MEFSVSRFRECDVDTVFAIQQAAFRPLYVKYHDDDMSPYFEDKATVLRKYTRDGTTGYLFYYDGKIVGAVRVNIYNDNSARISALCVLPEFQGRGIAQRALFEIEKMYPDVERWFLDTILEEAGNCHLYEKLGYKKTGKTEMINEKMTLVYYEKPGMSAGILCPESGSVRRQMKKAGKPVLNLENKS